MTPMCPHDVPVLVAGAGPAGLAAALELTRHDIPCLLIERRAQLSSHPRATVLSLRSMEMVRAWGLEADVRARSVDVDVDWRMLGSETLADAAAGTALPVGYPSPQQSRMISPTTPACVAQDDVEPAARPVPSGHLIRPVEVDDVGSQEGRVRGVRWQQGEV